MNGNKIVRLGYPSDDFDALSLIYLKIQMKIPKYMCLELLMVEVYLNLMELQYFLKK